jgi:hypothetical protein
MIRHEVFVNTSDGHRSIIIDDDFCQSLSVPVGDNGDSIALFISTWIALLADSPLTPDKKPYQLYRRFIQMIVRDGVKDTVVRFTNLAHELVARHTIMGSGSSIGDWIDGFKDTPVFFEYNRYFQTGDVKLLDFLYTFLNFGKKLEYVDESFNSSAFRGWLDVENRLSDLHLDATDLVAIRLILKTCLSPFSWRDIRPKFGPGSVSERGVRGRIGKIRNFQFDPLVDRFLFRGHLGFYGNGEDHGSLDRVIPDIDRWSPANGISSRVALLIFRPKNLKVARSVCMEPNTLMYFQQAVLDRFLELLQQSPLSRFIDISTQERNRGLALAGSITGEVDTIDLSSASDSLSLDLVKSVFPPSWLIPMLATRSHSAKLPTGEIRRLKKFAPMGSALCFPTQCIIFASTCIYAACRHTYDTSAKGCEFLTWLTPSKILDVINDFRDDVKYRSSGYQPLAVYGDDICVDRRLTDEVESILSRLGFSVNLSKSFTGSQSFRESCGGYYLAGHDITPVYYSVKGVRSRLSAEHVASQVRLLNVCFAKRYTYVYRWLRHSLTTWGYGGRRKGPLFNCHPIPYVSDPRQFGIVVSTAPRNNHLGKRYYVPYQRDEIRCWTISYDYKQDPGDLLPAVDAYELMRWWATHRGSLTIEDYPSVSRSDTGGASLRWRWIPAQ